QGATRPELLLLPEPPARRPADPRQPAHVSLRAAAALPARPGPARSGAAVAADLRAPQLGARAGRRAWAAPAADGLPPLRHRHDRSSPGQRALDQRRGAAAGPRRPSPKNRAARATPADRPHQEGAGRPLRFLPTELRLRGLSPRSNAVPAKPALGRGDSDALAPAPRWPPGGRDKVVECPYAVDRGLRRRGGPVGVSRARGRRRGAARRGGPAPAR